MPEDPELKAMHAALRELEALGPIAAERALIWLASRLVPQVTIPPESESLDSEVRPVGKKSRGAKSLPLRALLRSA